MSKICPETGEKVLYLECLECDTKACEKTTSIQKYDKNGSGYAHYYCLFTPKSQESVKQVDE